MIIVMHVYILIHLLHTDECRNDYKAVPVLQPSHCDRSSFTHNICNMYSSLVNIP